MFPALLQAVRPSISDFSFSRWIAATSDLKSEGFQLGGQLEDAAADSNTCWRSDSGTVKLRPERALRAAGADRRRDKHRLTCHRFTSTN